MMARVNCMSWSSITLWSYACSADVETLGLVDSLKGIHVPKTVSADLPGFRAETNWIVREGWRIAEGKIFSKT